MIGRTFALAILLAAPALAASREAWSAHDRAARAACIKAAGLLQPTASAPILFSDAQGKTAVLVTGRWPQPHMKRARATMLCLYDRRSRKAEAGEAKGWAAAR